MGLSIQQAFAYGTMTGLAARSNAGGEPKYYPGFSRDEGSDGPAMFRQQSVEPLDAGFGKGTISGQAAAARTLGYGVKGARRIVPPVHDTSSDIRAKAAEEREERLRETLTAQTDQAGIRRTAVSGARNLINGISRAVGMAMNRLEGTEAEETALGAGTSIEIGGERFDVQVGGARRSLMEAPSFDVQI